MVSFLPPLIRIHHLPSSVSNDPIISLIDWLVSAKGAIIRATPEYRWVTKHTLVCALIMIGLLERSIPTLNDRSLTRSGAPRSISRSLETLLPSNVSRSSSPKQRPDRQYSHIAEQNGAAGAA